MDMEASLAQVPHQRDSLLSTLRQPPPYSVSVTDLTIAAPVPAWTIPLAIPITVPKRVQKLVMGRKRREQTVPKELVRMVNLTIRPGELCAIVGGSGSGKTTLLNIIACRMGNLEVMSGSVAFNPLSKEKKELGLASRKGVSKIIGYVRQDDFLLPYLTVRETLTVSAALRLPASVDTKTRTAIVEQTILELGLIDAADTIVGGPFRKGISGGEKRRLSIGCTLVTMPSVLVCDEPTTGLDSFTAYQLLLTLSNLARRGRTVIVSIHQPRSDAFPLLDLVCLLSQGSVIYSGRTCEILPYFQEHGYSPASHVNPLDFVVDISSVDTRDDAAEEITRERVGRLVVAWREYEMSSGSKSPRAGPPASTGDDTEEKPDVERGIERVISRSSQALNSDPQGRVNWFRQTSILTGRNFLNVSRNHGQNVGLFLQAVLIGVAIGLAFLRPPETPAGIQSLKTLIYQSTPAYFYLSIIVHVWIQTGELIVFDRERDDRLYSVVPYVAASWLSFLPGNVIFPTVYAIIIYFMGGLRPDNLAVNVLSFIAQAILQQLAASGYALMMTAINRSFAQASLLANFFSIAFILSSGYLIVDLPVWVSWCRWWSPYYYGYHWIARLQFVGRTFACEGITGPARNACDGTNVLVGLRFPLGTPLYVYPLGLFGFVVVTQFIAILLLQFYHPGGVQHASQSVTSRKPAENEQEKAVVTSRTSVDVAVENLELTVSTGSPWSRKSAKPKQILANVDAFFPAGQVSVIMGPSGAGKSSLLQLLAGRLNSNARSNFKTSGNILLNGQKLDSSLSSLLAFVEQEDAHHLPALTVRETLRYAARLRLRDQTNAQKDARAEEVMRMLGLKVCADNLVGGPLLKGISGGEKRRLSLAIQLISDPAVLYADEPLSGLDAFTARNVMESLKDIALSGRTVIVSVHQPRSDIWAMFDNVLLLVRGGRSAYSGPREEVLGFFEASGHPCPKNFNPADFLLDVISVDYRSQEGTDKSLARVSMILDSWTTTSTARKRATREIPAQTNLAAKQRAAPLLVAFPVVLGRSFKNLRRQQDVFIARLVNPPFLALLFWLFFARLSLGPASAQDRVGLLQQTSAIPFVGMLACIAIFPTEKALFLHEWKSSARQSVPTFLLAYTVQEISMSVIASLLFTIIFTFGIGLRHDGAKFVEFWFTIFALLSTGESIGIIFNSFFDNGGLAVSLVSAGLTILSQLNGIISTTLPYWLKVIGWISPMKPQSQIELINEMKDLIFNCTQAEIDSGACIAATGNQLLETFGISPTGVGKQVGILAALIVIFRLLSVLAMKIKVLSV